MAPVADGTSGIGAPRTAWGDAGGAPRRHRWIAAARAWQMEPAVLTPVEHGIVERVAESLRRADLLPASEVNDSLLAAEAAIVEARLLLSSDAHLRGIDHARLNFVLQAFDLPVPIIATPREVVRKFLRR